MNIEIISIGDELLIGQVVNTNASWISSELNENGFTVGYISTVGDCGDEIKNSLDIALNRADVVLLTGGLGPTKDDITKKVLAEYFGGKLILNNQVLEDVNHFLSKRGVKINELNRNQALVPDNAVVVRNRMGTAPILWFERSEKVVVSMPGVPSEMKLSMTKDIIPRLKDKFQQSTVIHKTTLIHSIPESELAEMLSDWEESLPSELSLAYLPSPGKMRLRISTVSNSYNDSITLINSEIEKLENIVGDNIYGYEDKIPSVLLFEKLTELGKTISFAESCSGGLMSHQITLQPGASAIFKGSVVAYSNDLKVSLLGVSADDIEKYSAVSKQVVEQMAIGIRKRTDSDYAIAISGIAGPNGGENKEIGTVWIAWAFEDGSVSRCFNFGSYSRERVINRSADSAFIHLLQKLNGKV